MTGGPRPTAVALDIDGTLIDHDEGLWEFLHGLFRVTVAHPAARWIGVTEAFANSAVGSAQPSSVA